MTITNSLINQEIKRHGIFAAVKMFSSNFDAVEDHESKVSMRNILNGVTALEEEIRGMGLDQTVNDSKTAKIIALSLTQSTRLFLEKLENESKEEFSELKFD